jgi:selenide,water dikinase
LIPEPHPDLLVGFDKADDAGVVRLDASTALIQTVDFFSPVVDDPFDFGRIAAANAFSDVYAMGGRPLTAMNIVAFPAGEDMGILREILRGGLATIAEAGAILVGGHSVDDPEIKYGLSVTGLVHPKRILTNAAARPGDKLILTKPIGTGTLATALKRGKAGADAIAVMTASMTRLNQMAGGAASAHWAHACTDITGFGLLGHCWEMASASNVAIVIDSSSVPILPGAAQTVLAGLVPGGTRRNAEHFKSRVDGLDGFDQAVMDLLFDPQTSGGLLVSIQAPDATGCVQFMHETGDEGATVIGEVEDAPAGRVVVR